MSGRILFLVIFFGLFAFCLPAQQDSTRLLQATQFEKEDASTSPLPEITIEAIRITALQRGTWVEELDTLPLAKSSTWNVGELLERESGVFLKNYGPGSSATSSIRGGSAAHTQVLWNGLPISNPMLGQMDFSMLPLVALQKVQVSHGGQSTSLGSGAIGGVVHLQNKLSFEKHASGEYAESRGSFDRVSRHGRLSFSQKKWAISSIAYQQKAENDFQYRINPSLPERRQTHARFGSVGQQHIVGFRPNARQEWTAYYWRQRTTRQIPPTTTQNRSTSGQWDAFDRLMLTGKIDFPNKQTTIQVRTGFFDEKNYFGDTLNRIFSENTYQIALSDLDIRKKIGKNQILTFGGSFSATQAEATAYSETIHQKRVSALAAYQFSPKKFVFSLGIRSEWTESLGFGPLAPTFSAEYRALPVLRFYGKTSRNYRIPTLNDLYWQPGGNPDLRPEKGWSQELGASFDYKKISYSAAAFRTYLHDWILWSLKPEEFFWSAENLTAVHSRGIEQKIRLNTTVGKLQLEVDAAYYLVRSTNELALQSPKIGIGEQLWYVPRHRTLTGASLVFEDFSWEYRHRWISATSTQSEALPAYSLGLSRVSWQGTWKKARFEAFFMVDNLWDTSYRVVERRPMPGRNFQTGIAILMIKR